MDTKQRIFAFLAAIGLLFVGYVLVRPESQFALPVYAAGNSSPLSGYAWSSNVGWIHFNGTTYGVSENLDTGVLSGYAWSNVGWITFNQAELTGCPSGTCAATVNLTDGTVSGWARACGAFANKEACSGTLESGSGGWDGWIHLRGTAGGSTFGVTQANDCSWSGYAWGSDNIGWIHFAGTNYGVLSGGSSCNQIVANIAASPTTLEGAGDTTVSWSSAGATSCTGTGFATGGATSGSKVVAVSLPTNLFTVVCSNGSKTSEPKSVVVTINYPAPAVTLKASPNSLHKGVATQLQWTTANMQEDSCTLTQSGTSWSAGVSNAETGNGSMSSPAISNPAVFTITCKGLNDATVSASASVTILPSIREI